MELHLNIIGVGLILLAAIHGIFPRYFNWKEEFQSVSLINTQMMYVHTFFLAFVLLLVGILCLTAATEIIETPLGHKLSLGIGIFWFTRLLFQFFGYSSKLWKGKRIETFVHIFFIGLWTYLSWVFLMIYWG